MTQDDDGPDDGPPGADDANAPAGKRRRRRRRRGAGGGEAQAQAPAPQQPAPQQQARPAQPQPPRQPQQPQRPPQARERRDRDRPRPQQRPAPRPASDDDDFTAEELARDPLASRDRSTASIEAHAPASDDDDSVPATKEAWGTDDGAPAPAITLAADLPSNPPADDPDPTTAPVAEAPSARLGEDVASVVAARFVPAGRISWFDAGDQQFEPGERVMVDAERGTRLAWIATVPQRKLVQSRALRRVVRRATDADLRGEKSDADRAHVLRIAKDKATALRLPLKVFRVEHGGGKVIVYYTTDDRLDLRDFVSSVAQATGLRPELRQLGVRDEAKAVGGIGTCGLTLCCTTWLPEFAPVSIKMAKDQGLVLSPSKVSGQCGRLKCCLVYEQAAYAELRKGLPKLGKRVIGARGEGRVVEVDVLRQRVRVSYGPGDTEVVPAAEVKPLFPSGNAPREPEPDDETDDPSAQ
ncbi:MAG TPA: regulatory iron-sulfur-containing complex subunit RicT [Kofleriaceae bacterium]|nr:regulatory iron-sulfur-containing complex subunit RicT [Kofleriaceae bacterium]